MVIIDVKEITFNRADTGELLASEVVLENMEGKPTIMAKPLTRGKLQEIYSKATSSNAEERLSADNDIIKFGLDNPKLDDQQVSDLKPTYAAAISTAILSISLGIPQDDVGKEAQKIINKEEAALKKK